MTLATMTKEERSLLLFLETCAVDQGGGVDGRRMNEDDLAIAERWKADGFVLFGRIKHREISRLRRIGVVRTHWCVLSDAAWTLAHQERRARADRMMADRKFSTTHAVGT